MLVIGGPWMLLYVAQEGLNVHSGSETATDNIIFTHQELDSIKHPPDEYVWLVFYWFRLVHGRFFLKLRSFVLTPWEKSGVKTVSIRLPWPNSADEPTSGLFSKRALIYVWCFSLSLIHPQFYALYGRFFFTFCDSICVGWNIVHLHPLYTRVWDLWLG